MRFLKFIYREAGSSFTFFTILGILSGLANAYLIKFVSDFVAINPEEGFSISVDLVNEFLLIVVLVFLCQRIFSVFLINLSQGLIKNYRLKIIRSINAYSLEEFQQANKEDLYLTLTQDLEKISNAASAIVYATNYVITIIFCIIYLGFISWGSFLFTVGMLGLGILVYWVRQNRIKSELDEAREVQSRLFALFGDLIYGFKQFKMDRVKVDDYYENYIRTTNEKVFSLGKNAIVKYLDNSLLGQFFMFLLIAVVLFVFPFFMPLTSVVSYVFVTLYIIGPLEGLMALIPGIAQAEIALKRVEAVSMKEQAGSGRYTCDNFESLALTEVKYQYNSDDPESFSIGPINLLIEKGKVLFLVGGNGSGKTTLLNTITGMLRPTSGNVVLNGEQEVSGLLPENLFSPVFTDFHLFQHNYGYFFDESEVSYWLQLMQLDKKVSFEKSRFSTTKLSTGQRKRLALIIAVLEKKPVLVLDEWAADQDPGFRKIFYTEILSLLKSKGHTVLAITHDDHYFYCADEVYKMNYGQLERIDSLS
ncbi:MAG: putative cyclic peptide transporter [Crocinitomicaceae bacterium]|jgi:putative ATP-binding cassette transporter|nr:putative cyclic peptide transporter [Crocinitomicaceae bacterium]